MLPIHNVSFAIGYIRAKKFVVQATVFLNKDLAFTTVQQASGSPGNNKLFDVYFPSIPDFYIIDSINE